MKTLVLPVLLVGAALSAQAAASCNASAEKSDAYLRASGAVRKLPEFRTWSASHSFPVAFGAAVDKERLIRGRCHWSVTVYADRPERAELWRSFFVSRSSNRVAFVNDPKSGDPIALSAWRKQNNESIEKR